MTFAAPEKSFPLCRVRHLAEAMAAAWAAAYRYNERGGDPRVSYLIVPDGWDRPSIRAGRGWVMEGEQKYCRKIQTLLEPGAGEPPCAWGACRGRVLYYHASLASASHPEEILHLQSSVHGRAQTHKT